VFPAFKAKYVDTGKVRFVLREELAGDADLAAAGFLTARWAGPAKDFSVAMQRVADEVKQRGGWKAPGPRANFTAALCLAWPDGEVALFEGRVYGHLVWPPRGTRGFGYDPMFVPDGHALTFGEMEPDAKHAISHRARAFQLLPVCLGDDAAG
jgi:XTP/dITP diphosphohydrolase